LLFKQREGANQEQVGDNSKRLVNTQECLSCVKIIEQYDDVIAMLSIGKFPRSNCSINIDGKIASN